jgi:hypothetical protein
VVRLGLLTRKPAALFPDGPVGYPLAMKSLARWRGWLILALVLAAPVASTWCLSRLTAPSPGSPERLFLSIRSGMAYQEALDLLNTAGGTRTYSEGVAKDGRTFHLYISLPPPDNIKECRMDIDDGRDCWSATLFLGEGGVVLGKSFDPYRETFEILHFLHRLFGH